MVPSDTRGVGFVVMLGSTEAVLLSKRALVPEAGTGEGLSTTSDSCEENV